MKYIFFIVLMLATACLILISGLAFPTVIAVSVLVLAVISDFYTTWRCLKKAGREGNPVMALLFRKIGLGRSFGIMAIVWACFIMFRLLSQTESIQTAVALAYWLVPMNNLMVLKRLKRGGKHEQT